MIARPDFSGAARPIDPEERSLARHVGGEPGPTLVCIGGLHGNEPAGVLAIRRVARDLGLRAADLRGSFHGLVGNYGAFALGARFVERDLNRAWTEERSSGLQARSEEGLDAEDHEQLDLLRALERVMAAARGPVYVLDLHTTSGRGGIFSLFGDALPQRAFARNFPVPMIFGLEELVEGTLINFLGERGVVAITLESGRHGDPESVDRAAAAIWIAIRATGLLPPEHVPEATAGERALREATRRLPRALEIRHRHAIQAGDGFEMAPGFRSFDGVAEGVVVARDSGGAIRVPEQARLLMPLYQRQGEDGFFLVRPFSPFWMGVSSVLRRARVDRIAHLLPGVRRVPGRPETLVVDRRVARYLSRQLFHLLGFRRIEEEGSTLVMQRRTLPERPRVFAAERGGGGARPID